MTLKLIQIKAAASAKAMTAQLQTTFLKALGDPLSNDTVRTVVVENLLLLIEGLPRVDPIVKELNALVDSQKIDNDQKANVSMALALVIRLKGEKITGSMSETIC